MVLLVLRMRINFVVLLMLMGVHLLVLLVLWVGVHFWVLLMWLVGVHFVMLLVLPMRVHFVVLLLMLLVGIHLVVLLVWLKFVAGGVGQHGLEQVWWLTGLVSGRVHEGGSSLRLGVLLLNFRCFPGIGDFGALLWLLLELHLGVGWNL